MSLIDLRSDTVTKPTKDMLIAMCNAEVGDDVYGEDPRVLASDFGPDTLRFVTHKDVAQQETLQALQIISEVTR